MITFETVKAEAMTLPINERELLAHDLLDSIEESVPLGLSEDWKREIQRRIDEIESGAAVLVDGDEMLARLRAKFP